MFLGVFLFIVMVILGVGFEFLLVGIVWKLLFFFVFIRVRVIFSMGVRVRVLWKRGI